MAGRFDNAAVSGMAEAKAAFKALPDIARKRLNVATEATTQRIYRGAVRRVAPHRRYGFLQRYLDTSMNQKTGTGKVGLPRIAAVIPGGSRPGSTFAVSQTIRRKRKATMEVYGTGTARGARTVYPSKYAHLVEFGHVRGRGKSSAPPYPFMIPAAEAERASYLADCQEAGTGIEQDTAAIGMQGVSGNRFV